MLVIFHLLLSTFETFAFLIAVFPHLSHYLPKQLNGLLTDTFLKTQVNTQMSGQGKNVDDFHQRLKYEYVEGQASKRNARQ